VIGKALQRLLRLLKISALLAVLFTLALAVNTSWRWRDRPAITDLNWPVAESLVSAGESVSLIWFGVSTLLLDDGDTQLLIDGFFSRPAVAQILTGRISSDVANINYVMAE
jgi:hypothetical protein